MKKYLAIIFTALTTFIIGSCGKKNSPTPNPSAAVLTFPAQNSACTTGTIISATQSTITFTWNSAANADSYEIDIKNLLTGTLTTQTSTTNLLAVDLLRNTPYSWYVVSKSSKVSATSQSDTWKFYNAGPGTVSHPPFPADVLKPTFGQNVTASAGTINLSWTGSDPDSDLVNYDVYFGISATPPILKSGVTDMFLNAVSVTSGTTYYWKIISWDGQGNNSDSGVYQFKVN